VGSLTLTTERDDQTGSPGFDGHPDELHDNREHRQDRAGMTGDLPGDDTPDHDPVGDEPPGR
jgi:hypothetical protein